MFHQFNGIIHLTQAHVVGDKVIQLHLVVQVAFNHQRHTVLTLKPCIVQNRLLLENTSLKNLARRGFMSDLQTESPSKCAQLSAE